MKKIKIFIIAIIILIIIAGITVYCIDQNRMKNNEPVLFSTWGKKYAPPVKNADKVDLEQNNKYVKLEELEENYTIEKAIKDRCFIIGINELYNKVVLDTFIENVNNKIEDELRIINFTVEGDLIITDVIYNKDDSIIIYTDNTRDKFATQEDRKINSKTYNAQTSELKMIERAVENNIYIDVVLQTTVTQDGKEDSVEIILCSYLKDAKVLDWVEPIESHD